MENENKRICPYCQNEKVNKSGTIARVGGIKKQRFYCRECGKTFY